MEPSGAGPAGEAVCAVDGLEAPHPGVAGPAQAGGGRPGAAPALGGSRPVRTGRVRLGVTLATERSFKSQGRLSRGGVWRGLGGGSAEPMM